MLLKFFPFPLSDMDLRHQSSSMCIIMLGGEDTHPWSATKVGNPIPATIPVEVIRYGSSSSIKFHVYHHVGGRRHTPVVCNESREPHTSHYPSRGHKSLRLKVIWSNFFVESFGLKILSQVTTKLSQLHSNSRNKYVNSRKYHNVGHMRCMHARPRRSKDQLPLRSLRDLRSR